jgi:hypothetical protein
MRVLATGGLAVAAGLTAGLWGAAAGAGAEFYLMVLVAAVMSTVLMGPTQPRADVVDAGRIAGLLGLLGLLIGIYGAVLRAPARPGVAAGWVVILSGAVVAIATIAVGGSMRGRDEIADLLGRSALVVGVVSFVFFFLGGAYVWVGSLPPGWTQNPGL